MEEANTEEGGGRYRVEGALRETGLGQVPVSTCGTFRRHYQSVL